MLDVTEVSGEVAGQKFSLRSPEANMLFTVGGFMAGLFTLYMVWAHAEDGKKNIRELVIEIKETNKELANAIRDTNKENAAVLREMARATREQNCILSLPAGMTSDQRRVSMEACKRNSQ